MSPNEIGRYVINGDVEDPKTWSGYPARKRAVLTDFRSDGLPTLGESLDASDAGSCEMEIIAGGI